MIILLLFYSFMAQANFVGPHCNIKSIKRSVDNSNSQTIGISNTGKPIFKATTSSGKGEEVGMIIVAKGLSASIEVVTNTTTVVEHPSTTPNYPTLSENRIITLKNMVKITCKSVGHSSMELEVELENDKTKLVTAVSLSPGSPVNLGGIVSDLNSKNKNIDLSQGASVGQTEGQRQFEYWLEAN